MRSNERHPDSTLLKQEFSKNLVLALEEDLAISGSKGAYKATTLLSGFPPALASFEEEGGREKEEEAAAEGSPVKLRYGVATDQGARGSMEDAHLVLDSLQDSLRGRGREGAVLSPSAFFGVFDGHGGSCAAEFGRERLAQALFDSQHFPQNLAEALRNACLTTDENFYHEVHSPASELLDSGSTVLAAVLIGQQLVVANAGDSRAVLSKGGKAVDLTRDHKPSCDIERKRIHAAGGYVTDGRLSGQLSVARALGDYGVEELREAGRPLKRVSDEPGPFRLVGPLTAEPEVSVHQLTPEDEFLVLACDGLWDVLSSQRCVELARQHLREHNDPGSTAQFLVDTSLEMCATDNITCCVVCFRDKPPEARTSRKCFGRTVSRSALSSLQSALSASDLPQSLSPNGVRAAASRRSRGSSPSPEGDCGMEREGL